ncbi:MAG TPA: 30S ribosomal protein S5 [Candidatus Saccharimonadales bacterium]|nr:30S ribosomal protein S5 [Candidatus Saccharimonadales bacterium]
MAEIETKDIAGELEEVMIPENEERVVAIDRISRTVKGGRRIRFRALVVVGNRAGQVGVGLAKGADVQTAIAKAKNEALKTTITVPMHKGTIHHQVEATFEKTKVILKPAPEGHSIIAGASVRAVVELAGINNIVSKAIGSSSPLNTASATFFALQKLIKSPYRRS